MAETLERTIHFTGTYPATSDPEAMDEIMRLAGSYVETLPGGEVGKPNWVASKEGQTPYSRDGDLEVLKHHPALRKLGPGEKEIKDDYLDNDWRYVAEGEFDAEPLLEAFEKIYNQPVRDNWEKFKELRAQYGRQDLRYQFGLPSPLNPAIFAFRRASAGMSLMNGLMRYQDTFRELYQHVVDVLNKDPAVGTPGEDKNNDIVYHVEMPAEIAGLNKMPRYLQPATNLPIGSLLARDVARQIAGFPEGASVIGHPCKGDFKHKEYSHADTRLIVDFALALIRNWPTGRTLNGLHIPLGSGNHPPTLNPANYEPLGELAAALRGMPRPDGAPVPRLILGYIHESNSLQTQAKITEMIELATGEPVKHVAPNCGLSRIDRATARLIIARSVAALDG